MALTRLAVVVASLGCPPAFAACPAAPDVLPVALPNAAAAAATRIGPTSPDGTAWMVTGILNRCVEGDTLSAEFATPKEMGVTKNATVHLSITGLAIRFGNETIENNPTEWKLTDAAVVVVADRANSDPARNILRLTWHGVFLNLTDYQLAYTLFLIQN